MYAFVAAPRQNDGQSGSFLLFVEEKPQQDKSDGQTDTETQERERQVIPDIPPPLSPGDLSTNMAVDVSVTRRRTKSTLPVILNVSSRKTRERR